MAYRRLGLADRMPDDEELLSLMIDEPTLLRRPLVIAPDGETVVGFNAAALGRLIDAD